MLALWVSTLWGWLCAPWLLASYERDCLLIPEVSLNSTLLRIDYLFVDVVCRIGLLGITKTHDCCCLIAVCYYLTISPNSLWDAKPIPLGVESATQVVGVLRPVPNWPEYQVACLNTLISINMTEGKKGFIFQTLRIKETFAFRWHEMKDIVTIAIHANSPRLKLLQGQLFISQPLR